MLIYILVFFSTYFLMKLAEKKDGNRKKIILLIAILLPSILAGVRDYSVGSDTSGYVLNWFYNAVHMRDIKVYLLNAVVSDIAFLYALLNYIVASFTSNPHWFLFVFYFIEMLILFKAVYDNKDIIDPGLAILTYFFMFYNLSLNAARQSMALVIVLYSFKYIRQKKLLHFLIAIVVAMLFHSSAVIAFSLYFIARVVEGRLKNVVKLLLYIGLTFIIIGYRYLVATLVKINFISDRYLSYITETLRGGGYERIFLLCIPVIILSISAIKLYDKNQIKIKSYLSTYLGFSLIISLVAFVYTYAVRMAYYFDIMLVIYLPFLARNIKFKFKVEERNFNILIIIGYIIIYWFIVFVIRENGETVPYLFMRS